MSRVKNNNVDEFKKTCKSEASLKTEVKDLIVCISNGLIPLQRNDNSFIVVSAAVIMIHFRGDEIAFQVH